MLPLADRIPVLTPPQDRIPVLIPSQDRIPVLTLLHVATRYRIPVLMKPQALIPHARFDPALTHETSLAHLAPAP